MNFALTRAATNGSLDCVKRLLAQGADPDAADQDGYTSLMLAATNNFVGKKTIPLFKYYKNS